MIDCTQSIEQVKEKITRALNRTPKNVIRHIGQWNIGRSVGPNASYSETWSFGFDNFNELTAFNQDVGSTIFYGNIWGVYTNILKLVDHYNFQIDVRQLEYFPGVPGIVPPKWTAREVLLLYRGSVGGAGVNQYAEEPIVKGEVMMIPRQGGKYGGLFGDMRLNLFGDLTGEFALNGFINVEGYQIVF